MVRLIRSVCAGRHTRLIAPVSAYVLLGGLALALAETYPANVAGYVQDADAVCRDDIDLFVGDGDGKLQHFWLVDGEFVHVRTLNTNPDVDVCALGRDAVFFIDPAIGVLAYDRNPEREAIARPVYLQPPHGNGRLYPVEISLSESTDHSHLEVRDVDGNTDVVTIPASHTAALPSVRASDQTEPVASTGDAADDPVILVNAAATKTWIVGTDKKSGLVAYDLAGKPVLSIAAGRLNNVDAVRISEGEFLIAASNRTAITLDLFIANLSADSIKHLASYPLDFEDPYGLCAAQIGRDTHIFVGGKAGSFQEWVVDADMNALLKRHIPFDTQTEGCVVHPDAGVLYVGEEAVGVWAVSLADGSRELIDSVAGKYLAADVEGLDIYDDGERAYLVVSSQGDHSFVIYDLSDHQPLIKFKIEAWKSGGIDGVSETDGIALSSRPLPGYPSGILVTQDGHNVAPQANQNFKIIDWEELQALLPE